jgi:glycine dehydrogenase
MPSLAELEGQGAFAARHIGPNGPEIGRMLRAVGADSLDALLDETVPESIRLRRPLDLPPPMGEREAMERLRDMAARNRPQTCMIGCGYHGTTTPPVIQRNLFENPGWYTAYTPYQAEISQGRLEALITFQQMVMDLTGLELANASLLDEATAAAEAMTLAHRAAKSKANAFFVDADTHPQTLAVLETRARPQGIEIVTGDPDDLDASSAFGALLSYPGSSGAVRDWRGVIARLREAGALAVVATDLLALTLLTPPGELGADVAIGSAQRFGVPMGYGGPHAAFFAARDAHKRSLPGRIIGVSRDADGRTAYRMALQTREQHIRRDKATSNICTAQALLAIMAAMYAVWHGPEGLKRIAERAHRLACLAADALSAKGYALASGDLFDTLTLEVPGRAAELARAARERGIELREKDADTLGISFDETHRRDDLERLLEALDASADIETLDAKAARRVPEALARRGAYLQHPVFHAHRSETEMMRWLRRLQARDIALDRSMIPLGSCTMKLNAAAEMIPVSFEGFSRLHPFQPLEQAEGYAKLFRELEGQLKAITGFAALSLQPNAGSQGEYAGLLAIRRWHDSRGEGAREICLIPTSAHGTNPASAVMAGMKVVAVKCDDRGDVDLDDLRAKAGSHAERLAALMVTYPSTHGVFEEGIAEACRIVHDHGGQVYLDGANLNALVGVARPAEFGADVAHMNLHKTFCIPHGGGGPGVGPIGVAEHLAPFLPGHPFRGTEAPVAAAPWGSASILPISWAYVAMMGAEGLRRATAVAILNANYMAARLSEAFPVVYKGRGGRVAHELILDLREIKSRTGIGVEDVAKRLIDYGFHAPTMSWPVPETLMVEPTESEGLAELDRFCDALIAIRAEIEEVADGRADAQDNLLKRAPHPQSLLLEEWTRPYDRARAFFPSPATREDKFWPPVGRVDNVAGDRNLVCACPPVEAMAVAAE